MFVSRVSERFRVFVMSLFSLSFSKPNVCSLLCCYCWGNCAFIFSVFYETISIHWTIIFLSVITWWCRFYLFYADIFAVFFYYLTNSVLYRIKIKHFVNLFVHGKCLPNKWKKIFAIFILTLMLNVGLNHMFFLRLFLLDLDVTLAVYFRFSL